MNTILVKVYDQTKVNSTRVKSTQQTIKPCTSLVMIMCFLTITRARKNFKRFLIACSMMMIILQKYKHYRHDEQLKERNE